jgi:hypothetical protein
MVSLSSRRLPLCPFRSSTSSLRLLFARDESSVSTVGVADIPSQFKVTQQILLHWQSLTGLESQEEDAPKHVLFFKLMSWLGQIRPHSRDES